MPQGADARRKGPVEQGDGVEPPDVVGADRGPRQENGEHDVLDSEPPPVTVDLGQFASLGPGDPRNQLLQSAQRADPATEEAPEYRGECEHDQPDPGPADDGPVGERGADGGQRIDGEEYRGDTPSFFWRTAIK